MNANAGWILVGLLVIALLWGLFSGRNHGDGPDRPPGGLR